MTTPNVSTTRKHRKPNDIIKKELRKQGVTQVQAAFDLNLNRATFCLICGGYMTPRQDTRAEIAKYLGLPEKVLFDQVGK